MKRSLPAFFHATFWLWNLLFLGLAYVGILPYLAPFLIAATLDGQLPLDFSLTLVALVAVPTVSTILGIRLREQPDRLIRLFYGFEAPLLVLCLIRLFLLRELTAASTHILISIGIAIAAFLIYLLDGYASEHRPKAWLQLFAHSLMLLVGVYAGVILLFYAVPLAVYIIQGFFEFKWLGVLWDILRYDLALGLVSLAFWSILTLLLLFFSGTLFVLMPVVMATLYVQSGLSVMRQFAAQYGQRKALMGLVGVTVASLVMFVGFQHQPQLQALKLMQRPATTDQERSALLAKSPQIRAGLLNAYLAQYRYLSSEVENDHITFIYRYGMGLPAAIAQSFQATYNRLMSPFLYNGSFGEVEKAEKLYEQFFDTPIQKAERDPVNHALRSTWNRDEAKAGLLNFNQQKVWLQAQTVTVKEQDDWAAIELHEVYENQTPDQQEVFYSFSLPESAVITGLWLGDTDDRSKRFPFVVSPRGAAQQVYTEQVQQRVDPALLEQVGPRHYRLRAFPVPPKVGTWEQGTSRPTQMHLWLTYKVMQQPEGWALPHLGEKRNLFWTNRTQRIRNGKTQKGLDTWLEAYLPATYPNQKMAHRTQLEGYQLTAKPLTEKDYVLPQNRRFAIVLDGSRSLGNQEDALIQEFQWLHNRGFTNDKLSDNDADLYITVSAGATPQRLDNIGQFDPQRHVFYGTVQLDTMLQQFSQLRGDTRYDGILLITDEGSYELSDDKQKALKLPAPLWMVHLGELPPAYDDAMLQTIDESGGGVATDLPEVLRRQATQAALGSSTVSVADGYAWQMQPKESTSGTTTGFDPLAARQLILGLSRRQDMNTLENLDQIHAIAKRLQIVTPYSSMLVLVNDAQREALKQAEAQRDRFQREVESGKEELSQPFSPMNSAIPEPSTWAGIILVAIGFLGFKWRQRNLS